MKRNKKSRERPSAVDFSDLPFTIELPNFEELVAETLRDIKDTFADKTKSSERSQQTQRLFEVTREALFQFAGGWKVLTPFRRGERISPTAVRKIASAMKGLKKAPGPKTIQSCFETSDQVQRAGAALFSRQLLCITLGQSSGMIAIEGTKVRILDASALAKNVTSSLNKEVTEAELQDALNSALEITLEHRMRK